MYGSAQLSLILKLIYIVSTTPSLIGSTVPSALPLPLNHKSLLISTQVFWNRLHYGIRRWPPPPPPPSSISDSKVPPNQLNPHTVGRNRKSLVIHSILRPCVPTYVDPASYVVAKDVRQL
ncbi:hypothetical protein JMJ77_0009613 [Colletotrichum scovillei]|uniref:Uncharacterized protein n=1 Tax=Colletotrichum scovillei TaxID=1209932 RepID=A0A9P7R090_9PEZI|nr:hypothetical protein JMJ77_0009613 [Colletotrichum scovillei]KAG7052695.1 hypothetical protein JMJ78_0005709 [Colletotrichum scovillei]KAG7064985.1 hypothetical protein JMJ76_0012740 [Colletotrichum scovillei]